MVLLVSAGLGGGLLCAPEAPAQGARPVVRIGLVDTLLRNTSERMMQLVMRPFKVLMEAQTGMDGHLVLAGNALTLGHKLKEDQVQVGVFHGFEFAWARQKYPGLKPLIIAVNRHRYVQAKVMVHKDCKAATCGDLQGKVAALHATSREHCRLFFERRCTGENATPARFYGQITTPADAEDALDDVVDGKAQITVVDAVELENYRKTKPGRSRKLRALLDSEQLPCGVIAYHPGRFDEADVDRFRAGLIAARGTPRGRQMLELMRITAFEAVPVGFEANLAVVAKLYPAPIPPK